MNYLLRSVARLAGKSTGKSSPAPQQMNSHRVFGASLGLLRLALQALKS